MGLMREGAVDNLPKALLIRGNCRVHELFLDLVSQCRNVYFRDPELYLLQFVV